MATATISTPAGPFSVVAYGTTVLSSGFTNDVAELIALIHPALRDMSGQPAELAGINRAVEDFFDGDITAIDSVDVEQRSGAFIDTAWTELRKVAGGSPVTYSELAVQAGRPAAIRGAAQACARNAAALFVPCHRVIRSDGSLGGYRYGLDVKRWLLAHEATAASSLARAA